MEKSSISNVSPRLGDWIRRWVAYSRRHSLMVALSFAFLGLLGLAFATRIRVDADLESLLPRESPTIQAMRQTKARYGSTDLFTISIVSNDPALIARLQDSVKFTLEHRWDDVVYAQDNRDASFFRTHALLYLPIPYLEQLHARLRSTRDDIKQGPLGMDLLSDDPPPAKGPWFDASLPQQLGLPDEAADEFEKFLKPPDSTTQHDRSGDWDPKTGIPDSLRTRLIGALGGGNYVGVVQAVLKKPSSDIEYVKSVLGRSESMLAPLRTQFGDKMKIGVEGPYKDFEEVEALSSNGTLATLISVGLTLLIVVAYFRTSGAIFLVLGQALVSCLMTLGFVSLSYGRLNLYTMFVVAILFGMGTDFSLYLMGHAQRLRRMGMDWEQAIGQSLADLLPSLTAAATTTVAGLLTLLVSRFAGFYEFGVIATFGILASFVLTYLFLPAAMFLAIAQSERGSIWRWLSISPRVQTPPRSDEPSWLRRFTRITGVAMLVGALALVPFAFKVGFEYDFANLRDNTPSKNPGLPVREALNSKRTSSQPVVVLANDAASMDALHDTLMRRLTVDREPMLRSFLTLRTFVPKPSDQATRLPWLRRIDTLLSDPVFQKASGTDAEMVSMLRAMSKADTFGPKDIPDWALNMLRERDSSYGRIGFIYGRFNSSDAREAATFESKFGHLVGGTETLSSFASSFVYADVVSLVKQDSLRMSLLMLGILVVLLALLLRRVGPIVVCLIGMATCLAWILGLMGLLGVKVGVFNLIVITTIQAALTDVVIYLVLAWERNGRKSVLDLYTGMGALMSVAIGTTIAGYAGMSFTSHLGIRSMGNFALIGLGACVAVSLLLTPWLCQVILKPKDAPQRP